MTLFFVYASAELLKFRCLLFNPQHGLQVLIFTSVHKIMTIASENSQHFKPPSLVSWEIKSEKRAQNSILMICHVITQILVVLLIAHARENLLQPVKSASHIWLVTRHQHGISALVPQTSFREETSGGVAKCRPAVDCFISLLWSQPWYFLSPPVGHSDSVFF